ncbi:hypothetical protein [Hydrogenophaga sp. ANAO-22]
MAIQQLDDQGFYNQRGTTNTVEDSVHVVEVDTLNDSSKVGLHWIDEWP